ncbi:MFS transporter [Bifidobacterium sp. W8101]|nr:MULTISPECIES: oligopeptide:H+ symporter [Bifidobacterium]MBI0125704.1 MFS transporter [Bifidobacterium choladohabitans]MBI0127273.1 MFS transporter [Bifidobacterium sp. W8103]MBI0137861.1 MFS transporter [Bifidobacterium sp. W8105]MBI0149168.1 MFS transporter [Bifidobacterium sp. W8107]
MATSSEHVDEQSDKDQQDSNLVVDESGLKVDHHQEEELEHLRADRSFFGYPKGIGILATGNLFNSICWASYGAVMIYYLYKPWTKGLGFTQGEAAQLIAIVAAINSMFEILGSWLADRVFGARKALVIGNITKGLSCGLLAIPAFSIGQGRAFAIVGMVLMNIPIVGASNASLTGMLFHRDDSRRDGAFAIHAIANNIAGFITPVISAQLGLVNYHYGFAIGAVAALLYAAIIGLPGNRFFGSLGSKPSRPLSAQEKKRYSLIALVALVVIAAFIAVLLLSKKVSVNSLANTVSSCTFVVAILFFAIIWRSKRISSTERHRLRAVTPLLIMQIVIGVDYAIQGTTLLMFLDQRINRKFGGIEIAPGSFTTIVGIISLLSGLFFSWFWVTDLGKRWKSSSRLCFGFFFTGIANFLLIVPTVVLNPHAGKYSVVWLLVYYLVSNFGGFPYGVAANSTVAAIAPKSYETQMQTSLTLSAAIGTAIMLVVYGRLKSLDQQLPLFLIIGTLEIVVAVAVMMFSKRFESMILDD